MKSSNIGTGTDNILAPYPEPPWRMHGRGLFIAYRVPAQEIELPRGMSAVTVRGQALGLLAYIEYLAPSPLVYRELIFMPCLVSAQAMGGRRKRGYWVSRMYVDNEASLRGGREIWALPKTLARFSAGESSNEVEIHAEDGTSMRIRWKAAGPQVPVKNSVVTLQREGDELVGFRGEFSAKARASWATVSQFESEHPGWNGFHPKRCLPIPAAFFSSFDSQMLPPRRDPIL